MTTTDETSGRTFYVGLIFRDAVAQTDYAMTGNGLGQNITATVSTEGSVDFILCVPFFL